MRNPRNFLIFSLMNAFFPLMSADQVFWTTVVTSDLSPMFSFVADFFVYPFAKRKVDPPPGFFHKCWTLFSPNFLVQLA